MIRLTREIKIGIFALAMLASLYLGVNYLKGRDVFSSDRFYYALFDQTNGLQTSAQVLLRGVKVGSVTDIELNPRYPDKVVVKMGVKKTIAIPDDSHVVLFANGLMGDKAIELVLGGSQQMFDGGTFIPSQIDAGLFESASTNIEELVGEAKTMMQSLAAAADGLDSLLTRNAGAIDGVVAGAEGVMRDLNSARVGEIATDLRAFTSMLRQNSARFEGVITNLDNVTGQLADANLRGTVDSLGVSIARLNGVLSAVTDGDGSVARLLDDPALYDSLTVATGNLAALLEDLKANPGRYVHLSLFGRRR